MEGDIRREIFLLAGITHTVIPLSVLIPALFSLYPTHDLCQAVAAEEREAARASEGEIKRFRNTGFNDAHVRKGEEAKRSLSLFSSFISPILFTSFSPVLTYRFLQTSDCVWSRRCATSGWR